MTGNDKNFYGLENRIVNERWTETSTLLNENVVGKVIIENRRLSTIFRIAGPVVFGGFIGLAILYAPFSGGFM